MIGLHLVAGSNEGADSNNGATVWGVEIDEVVSPEATELCVPVARVPTVDLGHRATAVLGVLRGAEISCGEGAELTPPEGDVVPPRCRGGEAKPIAVVGAGTGVVRIRIPTARKLARASYDARTIRCRAFRIPSPPTVPGPSGCQPTRVRTIARHRGESDRAGHIGWAVHISQGH